MLAQASFVFSALLAVLCVATGMTMLVSGWRGPSSTETAAAHATKMTLGLFLCMGAAVMSVLIFAPYTTP